MNKKIYAFLIMFLFGCTNVYAAPNVKTEDTYDENTDIDKCPTSIIVQDNLKGSKDIDFSDLDCIYYKMDGRGNFLLDENGEKILREEGDTIDFSCLQSFLDKYNNEEFKEAANDKIADGFPTTNKYCPVYCVEENEFVFPGYAPVINSGGHFTWTVENWKDRNILDGLTVRLHGTKVCRTQVDLDAWVDDYIDTMLDIEDLIDIKDPTSIGSSDCTESADSGSGGGKTYCAFSLNPVSTTYHYISSTDYNTFKNYSELKDLAGTGVYSAIMQSTNISADAGTIKGAGQHASDADSNRYYVTSMPVTINDTSMDGIIKVWNNGQVTGFDAANYSNNNDMYNAALKYAKLGESNSTTTVIQIKIQVWERHCCTWYKDSESPRYWTKLPGWNINDGIPASTTYGYEQIGAANGCGLIDGGISVREPITGHGLTCCGGINETPGVTKCKCRIDIYGADLGWLNSATCRNMGGTVYGCETSSPTYSCERNTTSYVKAQKYYVKCGTNGTGDDQSVVAADVNTRCTTSSIPTCPSGYSYSPVTGKCYYANVDKIIQKLGRLLGLLNDLRQCQDQLVDYDYYLNTEMEVEYNKTSDSKNNYYFPHKDSITNTRLEKIETSVTTEKDGENLLGKYASEIVHPSEKSNYVEYVDFFGNTYSFSKNGVPLVACTLSGSRKTCTATNNTSLTDYWYDWYGRTYIALYEYRLDGDFYRWVKMPEGESISTMPTGDYLKYNRFIDIGYANYPVHYSTPKNKYEGLNIKITNIGSNNYLYNTYQTQIKNYNNSLTDNDLVSKVQQNELLHDCYYEVKTGEPYCPPPGCDDLGSVRIIYRPISLENPFPDIDASGRNTGSNWCVLNDDESDCSNNNDNVEKYILNNRNTEGSKIYNEKQPMYEITLNPSLIKQIREYNSKTDYDDYNLSCSGLDGEEGTKCRSNFVVDVPDIDLPSLSDYITGCGTEEWNACDNLDNYER